MTCTYVIAHKAKPAIRHYMSTGARAFPAQLTAYHESRRGPTRPSMLDIVHVAVASSIAKYMTSSHVLPTSALPREVPAKDANPSWHLGAAELALARPHRSDWAEVSIAWPGKSLADSACPNIEAINAHGARPCAAFLLVR